MSTTTQPGRARHSYAAPHPAWCRQTSDCVNAMYAGDLQHHSEDLRIPLSLHSPFGCSGSGPETTWHPSTADVMAAQPLPGTPYAILHFYGSNRFDATDHASAADSGPDIYGMDTEIRLTSTEARQLAEHLLMVADAIDGDGPLRGPAKA